MPALPDAPFYSVFKVLLVEEESLCLFSIYELYTVRLCQYKCNLAPRVWSVVPTPPDSRARAIQVRLLRLSSWPREFRMFYDLVSI